MTREAESKILERLEEWEQRDGQLPEFVGLYRQLVRIQSEAKSRFAVPKLSLSADTISERCSQGVPLLSFQELSPHWAQLENLVQEVIPLVTDDSPDPTNEAQGLRNIASNTALLEEVVRVWYDGSSLTTIAAAQHVDDQLLTFVVGSALKPLLSAYCEVLWPLVNQESWRRRYCPICGGKPDFAFLDRERGARWLLCLRCDAEWLFQRLECPYCGNQKQASLSYFTDDRGLYRLYVCEECRGYIKAIDLRRTQSDVLLSLERILTLDMDRQAQEAGYKKVV